MGLAPWITSAPSLLVLATAWAAGEAVGNLSGQRRARMPAAPGSSLTPHSIERTPEAAVTRRS